MESDRQSEAAAERDARRAERRGQLLDAAVEAIRAVGPGITMADLAKAGGITKPILYRHFGDREGLIGAIAERFAGDLLTAVTTPLGTGATGLDVVRSTVDAYIGFIDRETNLYRFMVQQPSERGSGGTRVSALIELVATEVGAVTVERLRAGGRDSEAALPWAYGVVGMVHQAGDWWVDHRTMSRDTLVDHLTELIWLGVHGRVTSGPDA